MKKIFYVIFVLSMFMVSCTKETVLPVEQPITRAAVEQIDEYVEVGILTNYSVHEESMGTKSSEKNNKLIGIQINEYNGDYGQSYCFGVFDDFNSISVRLRKGVKYNIHLDYMPNGKVDVDFRGGWYGAPFEANLGGKLNLNTITYASNNYLWDCTYGVIDGKGMDNEGNTGRMHMPYERYTSIIKDYVATENAVIETELTRQWGGFRFEFTPVEGHSYNNVTLNLENCGKHTYTMDKATNKIEIPIMTTTELCWNDETEPIKAQIIADGDTIFNGDITLKRNVVMVYGFQLKPADETNYGVNITVNEGGLSEEKGN